jgi:hypothetical protein
MTRRMRLVLGLLGLIVVAASCVLLAYAFWPLVSTSEQVPLAPTLFVPPVP